MQSLWVGSVIRGVTKCWLLEKELGDLERVALEVKWELVNTIPLVGRRGRQADEIAYPSHSTLLSNRRSGSSVPSHNF